MTKSEFRTTKSLSADLMRIEDSLIRNQKELVLSFETINNMVAKIKQQVSNVIEFRDSMTNITSSIRDYIDNLEGDMIGLEGLDLFEFKTSPDDVILTLRKCSDSVGSLDAKIENNLKLVIKAKGNGAFKDEIDQAHDSVLKTMTAIQDYITSIESSIKSLLQEINHFKSHSKDLLQHKIL